jgi:hypothetical protein
MLGRVVPSKWLLGFIGPVPPPLLIRDYEIFRIEHSIIYLTEPVNSFFSFYCAYSSWREMVASQSITS